jgi:hypothetical protein
MFLDYFALFLLIFVALVIFYGIIAIHDIPYEIAKRRNHPQQDALHVAGWISLFTLHVLWPLLWVWATLYREDRGWGFKSEPPAKAHDASDDETTLALREQIAELSARLAAIESKTTDNPPEA